MARQKTKDRSYRPFTQTMQTFFFITACLSEDPKQDSLQVNQTPQKVTLRKSALTAYCILPLDSKLSSGSLINSFSKSPFFQASFLTHVSTKLHHYALHCKKQLFRIRYSAGIRLTPFVPLLNGLRRPPKR